MRKSAYFLLILGALTIAPATCVQAAIDCSHEFDLVFSDSSASAELFSDVISPVPGEAADIGSGADTIPDPDRGYSSAQTFHPEYFGGALDPNLPNVSSSFESTSPWVVRTIVPEPEKTALAIALGAVAVSLLTGRNGRDNIVRSCLRAVLCRMPPHRG